MIGDNTAEFKNFVKIICAYNCPHISDRHAFRMNLVLNLRLLDLRLPKYLRWRIVLHHNSVTTRWRKSVQRRVDAVRVFHGAVKATRFTFLIDVVDSAATLIPQAVTPLAA